MNVKSERGFEGMLFLGWEQFIIKQSDKIRSVVELWIINESTSEGRLLSGFDCGPIQSIKR